MLSFQNLEKLLQILSPKNKGKFRLLGTTVIIIRYKALLWNLSIRIFVRRYWNSLHRCRDRCRDRCSRRGDILEKNSQDSQRFLTKLMVGVIC